MDTVLGNMCILVLHKHGLVVEVSTVLVSVEFVGILESDRESEAIEASKVMREDASKV
ncbi:hypothetical protein GGI12_004774, partial [Dipsacomyces acuminosporus]